MKIYKTLSQFDNLKHKNILITGATGGIGSKAAEHFAKIGANLIIVGRNKQKNQYLVDKLKAENASISVNAMQLDLCDINSVEKFLSDIQTMKIDFFIHNAGIYNLPRETTSIGIDHIFQTNCLMPFYICKRLMPWFEKNKTKVIYTGSIAYDYSKINPDDIQFLKCSKVNKIYGNSKRLAMFALSKLFAQSGLPFAIAHPGLTLTEMTNHYPKGINWLVRIALKISCPPPASAALSLIYACSENVAFGHWIGPKIGNIWGMPQQKQFKMPDSEAEIAYTKLEDMIKSIQSASN